MSTLRRSPFALVSMLLAAGAVLALVPACIGATNPYDPDTPLELQAKATLKGRIEIADPGLDDETRVALLSALRVGLLNDEGKRVERGGDRLAQALVRVDASGGNFQIEELTPGTYTVTLDNAPTGYDAPAPPVRTLRPGATADVGTLVLIPGFAPGEGPGVIRGDVVTTLGDPGTRSVSLFRLASDRVELVDQQPTSESFTFDGLALGTYALVAEAPAFAETYVLDLAVGEAGDAQLEHDLSGDAAVVLRPRSAVLLPQASDTVRIRDGVAHVRGDSVDLAVVMSGTVTGMRFSFDPSFTDDAGMPLPFVEAANDVTVPLPDVQGAIRIYGQLEAASETGFAFTSEVFDLEVVRDTVAPEIVDITLPDLTQDADGVWRAGALTVGGATARIDALDAESGIDEVAIVVTDTEVEPLPDAFAAAQTEPGLVRFDTSVDLAGEGALYAWFFLRDRAGNTSASFHLPLMRDLTPPPQLPLSVDEAIDGVLYARNATLRFDTSSLDPSESLTMVVGAEPLDPDAPEVPFSETVTVAVPADLGDGAAVTFVARLIDRGGNEPQDAPTTGVLTLSLRAHLAGSVELLRSNEFIGFDATGTSVTVLSSDGDILATDATDADGAYYFDAPEVLGARIRVARPGWRAVEFAAPALVAVPAASPITLDTVTLQLAEGSVRGVFRRADLASSLEEHAGIAVQIVLDSPSRTYVDEGALTQADGTYVVNGLPATFAGEQFLLRASKEGYSDALASAVVADNTVTVIGDVGGAPSPIFLGKTSFAFDVCEPGAVCTPGAYFNDDVLRIRLLDTGVDEIRVRARTAFDADDATPAFQPFPATNDVNVDVSGADGLVEIYVQTRTDGVAGEVMLATITRDRTAPTLIGVERSPTPGAYDARFTRFSFVDLVVDADAGTGAVAPLASTPMFARAFGGAPAPATPPTDAQLCAPTLTICRASLPGAPDAVAEGRYDVGVWACDAAGNCSAPVDTTFIADQTPPSSGHGVAIEAAGDYAEVGGVIVVADDDYDLALDVGTARDGGGNLVLDENGDTVADVLAARFSRSETTADATVRALDPTPVADELRGGLTLPALPGTETDTNIYAQLFDGAGNATLAEPNAFVRTVRLDRTAPAGLISINSGASYATSTSVTVALNVAAPESGLSYAIGNGAIDCAAATYAVLSPPASVAHTLTTTDGTKTVRLCVRDAVGNTSSADDTITLDTADPVGTVRITDPEGNDDGYTSAASVTLVLTLPGEDTSAAQMAIAEGTTLDCASGALSYEAFSSTKAFPLSNGQGTKNIVACFRDGAGRVTPAAAVARASIVVDTTAPSGTLDVVEGRVFSSTHFVALTTVTAKLTGVSADVTQLSIAQGSLNCSNPTPAYAPFSAVASVALTSGEGDKTIEACLKDAAGLTTKVTKLVRLDQTAPTGTITLDADATYSTDTSIVVRVTSAETGLELKVPATDCSPPFGIAAFDGDESSTQTISAVEGTRTLSACLRDPAGNTTLLSDSILVDLTAPSGFTIAVAGGAAKINISSGVPVSVSTPVGVTDVTHIALADRTAAGAALNCSTASYVALPASPTINFASATNETKRVDACFRDAAGNVSATSSTDTIVLDTALATASLAFALSGTPTATVTRVQAITATFGGLNAQGIRAIEISEQATFADAVPFSVPAGNDTLTLPFTLSGGDGSKTVRARVTDDAGNTATLTNATIFLDTTAPSQPQFNDAGIVTSLSTFTIGGLGLPSSDGTGAGMRDTTPYDVIAPGGICPTGTTVVGTSCQWNGASSITVTLQANVENRVQVRGVDRAGNASSSDLLIITQDSTAPASVTNIAARADDQMAQISWSRSTSGDVLGYSVHYMLNPTGGQCPADASLYDGAFADEGASPIDVGQSPQITLTGLTNGLEVCVMVTARDRAVPNSNEDLTPGSTAIIGVTPEQTPLYHQGTLSSTQLGTSGRIGAVGFRQGLLYIAAQNTGLIELDGSAESCFALTNATAFQSCTGRVASSTTLNEPRDLVLSGAFAFVGDSDGVEIFRISEGSAPVHVLQLAHTNVRGVDVFRDLLAVAHENGVSFYDTTPLSASTPAAPTLRATFGTTTSYDVDIQGTLAAVSQGSSVALVDITNPAAPVAHARQCAPTSIPLAVRFAGETLHVSNTSSEIRSCAASDTGSPRAQVSAVGGSISFIRRMEVVGPYVIGASPYGLLTLDASNPYDIEVANETSFPSSGNQLNAAVTADGYRVFAANGQQASLEWYWLGEPTSFGQVGTDGAIRVQRGVYAEADAWINGEKDATHWGRDETTLETVQPTPFSPTEKVIGENGFFVSLRDAWNGGNGQYATMYRTEDGATAPVVTNIGTCWSSAGVVRWPYLVVACANAATGGTLASVHVRNLETNVAVATQNVVTLPAGTLEHSTSRLAIYGDQVLVAVSRQSPSNASPEGVYAMTFNPLTGALGAATLVDAGDYSGIVPVGRRIYVSRDTNSLRVVRMPTTTFDPSNVTVVGTGAPSLGWTYLGTPAITGELLVIPGNSNGFQIARISFDTTGSTYPAMEPRVYLRLARSSATNAHVMADRIYLSAYDRSLEIFEIR